MDYGLIAGNTNATIYLRLRDSTTGLAKTGLAYNSAGSVCSYTLPLAARAAITLATQTVTGAHSDGGFVEVDATNCKGLYRLDLPDAAIASGAFTCVSIEFDGTIEETVLIPLHKRKVDLDTIKTQAVTCAAGVTVLASVGTAATSTAQTGDSYARLGAPAGSSVSADVAAVKAETAAILDDTDLIDDGTSGLVKIATDVAAILVDTGTTLQAELDGIQADTEDIQSRLPAALDGGLVSAKLADGVTHGGTTALLRLGSTTSTPAFYATNSGGDAVQFTSSAASGHGLATGGGTSGRGISATGAHGIFGQGTSSGIVGYGTGGASAGIIGQSVGVVGYGFLGTCTTANGAGAAYIGGTGGYSIYAPGHIFGNVLGSVGSVLGGINTTSGTITTLDALDTAQDLQHAATQGATFDTATDSLEAIRNRGDAEWITATGFSTLSAGDVNAQVLDVVNVDTIVAGVTIAEALRRVGAITAGQVSGAGTGTETFLDWAESAASIVVTVDGSGNRSSVVFN